MIGQINQPHGLPRWRSEVVSATPAARGTAFQASDGGGERDGDPAAAATAATATAATAGSPPLDGAGGDRWFVRGRRYGGEEPPPARGGDDDEWKLPPLCPAGGGVCASRRSSASCSGMR